VGARNDVVALREARQQVGEGRQLTARVLDEIGRMREQVGRPDYGKVERLLGQLALRLAKTSEAMEEMWSIRLHARQVEEEGLDMRLTALEASMAALAKRLGGDESA
jgi:hypothetical protein